MLWYANVIRSTRRSRPNKQTANKTEHTRSMIIIIIIIIDTFIKRHKCLGYRGAVLCPASSEALKYKTSGYATWFTAGGAIRIGHYDVIDNVITQKL